MTSPEIRAQMKTEQAFGFRGSDAGSGRVEIRFDSEIEVLPSDRAVTILGWENLYGAEIFSALFEYGVNADEENVRIGRNVIPRENHSIVLMSNSMLACNKTSPAATGQTE